MKYDDTEDQDRKLKQLSESCRDDVGKAKEMHKASLQNLRSVYEDSDRLTKQATTDIGMQVLLPP